MYSFTNYTFETESADEQFRAFVEEKLAMPSSGLSGDRNKNGFNGNRLVKDEDNVRYTLDMLCEVLAEIARKFPDKNFLVTGVWDTSSTAGELMDFIVTYRDGSFTARTSEWYVEEDKCLYDSYEEFCECNEREDGPPLTREEFDEWKDGEFMYSLNSGDGDFVREVPVIYDYGSDFTIGR